MRLFYARKQTLQQCIALVLVTVGGIMAPPPDGLSLGGSAQGSAQVLLTCAVCNSSRLSLPVLLYAVALACTLLLALR